MTVYELKKNYQKHHPDGHFFDRQTLKFFGETESKMYVHKNKTVITDISGKKHHAYILSSMQRKHPCGPRRVYHYFDAKTFDQIIT